MPSPPDLSALSARRDELRRQLAAIGDLRPGSLVRIPAKMNAQSEGK